MSALTSLVISDITVAGLTVVGHLVACGVNLEIVEVFRCLEFAIGCSIQRVIRQRSRGKLCGSAELDLLDSPFDTEVIADPVFDQVSANLLVFGDEVL